VNLLVDVDLLERDANVRENERLQLKEGRYKERLTDSLMLTRLTAEDEPSVSVISGGVDNPSVGVINEEMDDSSVSVLNGEVDDPSVGVLSGEVDDPSVGVISGEAEVAVQGSSVLKNLLLYGVDIKHGYSLTCVTKRTSQKLA